MAEGIRGVPSLAGAQEGPDGTPAAARRAGSAARPSNPRALSPGAEAPIIDRMFPAQSVSCSAVGAVLAAAVLLAPVTHAAVRPPRLDYTMTTLPNGLKVVFLEDHSTPIVHLQMWYHVGAKNERPGRTGFAHFFEHMMFKGSKNVEPEGPPSYISSVGGQSNAYTNEDATVFWETVPSQYLPLVLWLEADRMASLKIEEKAFKNDPEVVNEKRPMRIHNHPYTPPH